MHFIHGDVSSQIHKFMRLLNVHAAMIIQRMGKTMKCAVGYVRFIMLTRDFARILVVSYQPYTINVARMHASFLNNEY